MDHPDTTTYTQVRSSTTDSVAGTVLVDADATLDELLFSEGSARWSSPGVDHTDARLAGTHSLSAQAGSSAGHTTGTATASIVSDFQIGGEGHDMVDSLTTEGTHNAAVEELEPDEGNATRIDPQPLSHGSDLCGEPSHGPFTLPQSTISLSPTVTMTEDVTDRRPDSEGGPTPASTITGTIPKKKRRRRTFATTEERETMRKETNNQAAKRLRDRKKEENLSKTAQIADLTKQVSELSANASTLQNTITGLQQQNTDLQKDHERLEQANRKLELEKSSWKSDRQHSSVEASTSMLQECVTRLQNTIDRLQQENTDLQKEHERLEQANRKLELEKSLWKSDHQHSSVDVSTLQESVTRLQYTVDCLRQDNLSLQHEGFEVLQANTSLQLENARLISEFRRWSANNMYGVYRPLSGFLPGPGPAIGSESAAMPTSHAYRPELFNQYHQAQIGHHQMSQAPTGLERLRQRVNDLNAQNARFIDSTVRGQGLGSVQGVMYNSAGMSGTPRQGIQSGESAAPSQEWWSSPSGFQRFPLPPTGDSSPAP